MTPPHVLNARARIVLSDFVNDHTTADILTDQVMIDTHARHVGEDPNIPDDQGPLNTQDTHVVGDLKQLNGHSTPDTQAATAVEPPPRVARELVASIEPPPLGEALDSGDHIPSDTQPSCVAAPFPQGPTIEDPITKPAALGLADPLLALAADVLDDLERVRIANKNRLQQLTRDEPDADGQERGFGLTLDHPDVARLAALVNALTKAEHDATLNLQRMVRRHPLGPWIKQAKGVGEKQAARLLAAIGDPYWNDLHNRPRLVSELVSFCGYAPRNLPVSHDAHEAHGAFADGGTNSRRPYSKRYPGTPATAGTNTPLARTCSTTQMNDAGGAPTGSDPDHGANGVHHPTVGVAATRQRGVKVNWSPTAKMRAYLIAESIVKAGGPYRQVYDDGRAKYADAVHQVECKRCGPAGKPAPTGSPLSAGHQHARALRLVAKTVLRDLWREARRIHEAPTERAT